MPGSQGKRCWGQAVSGPGNGNLLREDFLAVSWNTAWFFLGKWPSPCTGFLTSKTETDIPTSKLGYRGWGRDCWGRKFKRKLTVRFDGSELMEHQRVFWRVPLA